MQYKLSQNLFGAANYGFPVFIIIKTTLKRADKNWTGQLKKLVFTKIFLDRFNP
jgi:hypothetical protein